MFCEVLLTCCSPLVGMLPSADAFCYIPTSDKQHACYFTEHVTIDKCTSVADHCSHALMMQFTSIISDSLHQLTWWDNIPPHNPISHICIHYIYIYQQYKTMLLYLPDFGCLYIHAHICLFFISVSRDGYVHSTNCCCVSYHKTNILIEQNNKWEINFNFISKVLSITNNYK